MKERDLASKWRKEFNEHTGCHCRPLIDAYNTQKKPYDSYFLVGGCFAGIEFKKIDGLSINGSILVKHQAEGLLEVEENGGYGLVWVFATHKSYKGKLSLLFSVKEWIELFDYDLRDGKAASVKVDKLCKNHVDRKKLIVNSGVNKTVWDFPKMLDLIF